MDKAELKLLLMRIMEFAKLFASITQSTADDKIVQFLGLLVQNDSVLELLLYLVNKFSSQPEVTADDLATAVLSRARPSYGQE